MQEILKCGVLLGMLGGYAVEDLRKHTITAPYLIFFGLIGIGIHLYWKDTTMLAILSGIAVGLGLIILSVITRGSIGMGDGYLFLVTGIFLGGGANVELLFISLIYAAVVSLIILICDKERRGRKREIPFIPFVFVGYLTMMVEAFL